jgi:LPS sulfotransferase NodH
VQAQLPVVPLAIPHLPQNPHLAGALSLFGGSIAVPADAIPPHDLVLFLCFTNRSGSNHLAELLAATGRFNLAGESFNAEVIAADTHRYGHASFANYLAAQMHSWMVEGRFAVKLALPHLELLGRARVLDALAPRARYLMIERADRLGQAISYEIARQTGRWTSAHPGHDATPLYGRARILDVMETFAEENRCFDLFFGHNGIVPLPVVHEDAAAAPAETIARIGRWLGLPGLVPDLTRVGITRQADGLNVAWREAFLGGR